MASCGIQEENSSFGIESHVTPAITKEEIQTISAISSVP